MPRHKLLNPMITLTARVPATLAELIRRDAAEADRTRSQIIKIILARHYAEREAS
jgi:Ribbon-helix-helix protein, copG family